MGRAFRWFSRSAADAPIETPPASTVDFRALTEGSVDIVCVVEVTNHRHRIIYASPSTFDILGWSVEEFLHLSLEEIYTAESNSIIAADVEKISSGQQTSMVVVEAMRKDGQHVWLENKVRVLAQKAKGELSVMVCMRDVTERKLLEEQLARLALVDGLTGIDNRRAFDQGMEREWKRTLRTGLPISLVLLDVDHFKLFNDSYGHLVGDDCLRAIAEAVRGAVRRAGDIVARYGGEELAVLLPDTDMAGAERLANHLCRVVAGLRIPHCKNPEAGGVVTISCGVSTALARLGGTIVMPEGLLLAADSALYKAKDEGRNRVATSLILVTTEMMRGGE